jgi:hypothetical protein
MFDWHPPFNENTVDGFIKEYRDTVALARLSESDIVAEEVTNSHRDGKGEYVPKVGDYVQWESQGVWQFGEPKRVREFSPDGKFAFVDGSSTGVPSGELRLAEDSALPPVPPVFTENRVPPPPKTHMQEFVVPLSNGSRAVFQWPNVLTKEDVDDLGDSLKILERKISRSVTEAAAKE